MWRVEFGGSESHGLEDKRGPRFEANGGGVPSPQERKRHVSSCRLQDFSAIAAISRRDVQRLHDPVFAPWRRFAAHRTQMRSTAAEVTKKHRDPELLQLLLRAKWTAVGITSDDGRSQA